MKCFYSRPPTVQITLEPVSSGEVSPWSDSF